MEPAPDLKEFLGRFYAAFAEADIGFIERHLCRHAGMLSIGTDPAEWWESQERCLDAARAQLAQMKEAGIALLPGDALAYREGTVSWIADRPHWRLPDESEVPGRLTAVLHLEDGEWKLVQSHASVGLRNEETVGTALVV